MTLLHFLFLANVFFAILYNSEANTLVAGFCLFAIIVNRGIKK